MDLMKNNIVDYLDEDRSKVAAIQVQVKPGEDRSFPVKQFFTAVFMVVTAMAIFFGLPYSMLTLKISVFVIIFLGLLMGLLIGVLCILLNFSYAFETFFLWIIFWEKKWVKSLINMNLISHRVKNRRSIMILS
jgi:uncharacterized membrane protein